MDESFFGDALHYENEQGDSVKQSAALLSVVAALCLMPSVSAAQSSGASLFQSNCLLCHGADGEGTPTGKALKVVSFHDPTVEKMSDAELAAVIHDGKNSMPAFGNRLTSPQIESLVSYIRELQKK